MAGARRPPAPCSQPQRSPGALALALKMMPAIVVPVFHALGKCTPLLSSMALRLQLSKLKPPPFEPPSATILAAGGARSRTRSEPGRRPACVEVRVVALLAASLSLVMMAADAGGVGWGSVGVGWQARAWKRA